MRFKNKLLLIFLSVISSMSLAYADSIQRYTKMENDLKELKADFNANVDKVRLVFLPSPT